MAIAAAVLFFIALAGITILFALKALEMRRGRHLAPALRTQADGHSLVIKAQLAQSRAHLGNIPPLLSRFGWFLLHESALGFAKFARITEREAHRLADFVSQKHRFERRATTSEFLRRMSAPRARKLKVKQIVPVAPIETESALGETENI